MRIAIVTGASSGIGREFARQISKALHGTWTSSGWWQEGRDRLKELERELGLPLRIFDGDLNRDYICEKMEKNCLRQYPGYPDAGKCGRIREEWESGEIRRCEEQLGQMVDLNCRSLTRMIQHLSSLYETGKPDH